MGEPMLTEEQATKLNELIHEFTRITAKCAAKPYPSAILRLALIQADKALTQYIEELTSE